VAAAAVSPLPRRRVRASAAGGTFLPRAARALLCCCWSFCPMSARALFASLPLWRSAGGGGCACASEREGRRRALQATARVRTARVPLAPPPHPPERPPELACAAPSVLHSWVTAPQGPAGPRQDGPRRAAWPACSCDRYLVTRAERGISCTVCHPIRFQARLRLRRPPLGGWRRRLPARRRLGGTSIETGGVAACPWIEKGYAYQAHL
jgi:hypothetical protein